MIRALIAAGADPNLRVGNVTPLGQALYHGAELTEVLLAAGADPNALDDAGRPVWWGALQTDRDPGLPLVHLLLEHGADLTLRDRESGPVAFAADLNRNWPVVLLLMERGAAWKGEARFGTTFESMVDFEARNTSSRPAELALIQAMMSRR
jgi:ankyrin repeat protein